MGNRLTQSQREHVEELRFLTQKSEYPVCSSDLRDLVTEIGEKCEFYLQRGTLKIGDWERIGQTLHQEPRADMHILQAWHKCQHAVEKHSAQLVPTTLVRLSTQPPPGFTLPLAPALAEIPIKPTVPPIPLEKEDTYKEGLRDMLERQADNHHVDPLELAEMLPACPVHITGQLNATGQFTDPLAQGVLPPATFIVSFEGAFRAHQKIPESVKPAQNFSIRQGSTEPYSDFVNHALKRQIDNHNVQSELLLKLAKGNATKECSQAIIGLGPSLAKVLKACQASYQACRFAVPLSHSNKPQGEYG
ncbi:hypothetical protein lerEdw1_021054 [Lerista edwardsae]|nr:hypothetical protein lerEdw1_021054 [Lerista edwardsae]